MIAACIFFYLALLAVFVARFLKIIVAFSCGKINALNISVLLIVVKDIFTIFVSCNMK